MRRMSPLHKRKGKDPTPHNHRIPPNSYRISTFHQGSLTSNDTRWPTGGPVYLGLSLQFPFPSSLSPQVHQIIRPGSPHDPRTCRLTWYGCNLADQ